MIRTSHNINKKMRAKVISVRTRLVTKAVTKDQVSPNCEKKSIDKII